MEARELNRNYQKIAEELIDTEPALAYIKDSRARIAYLQSDSAKKDGKDRVVHGECEKVAPKNKWAIDYDFTITLYFNNNIGMSEAQLRVLMFHELLHVGIDHNSEGGEVYGIRKHDLQDFREIVDRYGVDWAGKPVEA